MYNFLFFNVIFVTVNFNLFLAIAAILVASLCAQQTSSTPAPVYYIIVTDTSALRSLPEGTVVYPVQQPNPQPLESAPKPVHHSASSDAFTDERGQTPNAENPRRPKRARSSFYFSPSLNFVANILKMERDVLQIRMEYQERRSSAWDAGIYCGSRGSRIHAQKRRGD